MIWSLSWLVAVELLGVAALPLAVRFLRPLPDRGFIFAKPLGVLLVGYLCWLLGVFGVLRFERATIAVVLLVVAAGSWTIFGRLALKELSSARAAVWVSEGLFLLSLAGAALVRAYNPEISGTEKPMDFAFLNALYRGDALPPEDPWMSGHSISYYYFGYLLVAVVAKLSGVPAAVGYNLGVALVFALLLASSYSLAFNLISSLFPGRRPLGPLLGAATAPVLVGLMGNLEIGLEVLAARGFGDASFWKAAGIKGLQAATQPEGWFPTSHWWWWRASRVIPTTKPDGINEFPYFSFLLGDLHPHFTALPWALLIVALSLAVLMRRSYDDQGEERDWLSLLLPAMALGFLFVGNSWDFPTYTALFWACWLLPAIGGQRSAVSGQRSAPLGGHTGPPLLARAVRRLALMSLCSVLMYSPFLLGFSSQAKGVGIADDKTPLASMLTIFGPFLYALAFVLLWWSWPPSVVQAPGSARRVSWLAWGVGLALLFSSWLLGAVALLLGFLVLAAVAAYRFLLADGPVGWQEASARVFLLILVGGALMLVLVAEFVFLADSFGTRMNTVFKFHYQAWLLLGLATSAGIAWLAARARSLAYRLVTVGGAALLVGVGLLYPLSATPAKTQGHSQPTLDGAAFFQAGRPDDYEAIRWLTAAAVGRPVVLEATGGEYSEYARVSTFSGLPTVLGWAGHELQWRGRGEEAQQRTQDIDSIYKTADPSALVRLLQKYRVEYVYVGSLEIDKYGPGVVDRFEGLLELAHRQGRVAIYRVKQSAVSNQQSAFGGAPSTRRTFLNQ